MSGLYSIFPFRLLLYSKKSKNELWHLMARTLYSDPSVYDIGAPVTQHFFTKISKSGTTVTCAHVTTWTSRMWLIGSLPHIQSYHYYCLTFITHLSSEPSFFLFKSKKTKKQSGDYSNVNHRVTIWSGNSTPRYRYKKTENMFMEKICTWMFTAVLLVIAKRTPNFHQEMNGLTKYGISI